MSPDSGGETRTDPDGFTYDELTVSQAWLDGVLGQGGYRHLRAGLTRPVPDEDAPQVNP